MKKIVIIALVLFGCLTNYAQNIIEKEIDGIFNEWNQENHPGGVISITKEGEILFSKAYGQANIKYEIPNTNESIFNIGSVSKQFTAMGIVLLHLDGKLSIDDDVRKYLPELYEMETPVTLRHLLHHTSGIRSTPELFGLAGWRDGDAITTEDDFNYLCKQNSLNFPPNSQFMYSNSGYILLAKIIESTTNQPFSSWMKNNVFSPLKMMNTFVDETNSNANPKVSAPYNEFERLKFTHGENTSMDIGASNIYTTASDLSKWMSNFRTPTVGWTKAFSLLQTTDKLSNGESNDYAFGVIVDDFFGNKRIQHTGGVPGFLSYAMYYPEEELTIILLTNFVSPTVNDKYMMLSQLFLENKESLNEKLKRIKGINLDLEAAKTIVGNYWNLKGNYPRKIYLEQDTLWYLRANGMKSHLVQTDLNQFVIGGIDAIVKVQFEQGEKRKMIVMEGDNPTQFFEEYDNSPLSKTEMQEYTGSFYSQELETSYKISQLNDQLMGYHSRHGEFPIQLLKKDLTDWSGFAISQYVRNNKNEITGFYVSLDRVKNVWFEKE